MLNAGDTIGFATDVVCLARTLTPSHVLPPFTRVLAAHTCARLQRRTEHRSLARDVNRERAAAMQKVSHAAKLPAPVGASSVSAGESSPYSRRRELPRVFWRDDEAGSDAVRVISFVIDW
jgi:hypothetical protein